MQFVWLDTEGERPLPPADPTAARDYGHLLATTAMRQRQQIVERDLLQRKRALDETARLRAVDAERLVLQLRESGADGLGET